LGGEREVSFSGSWGREFEILDLKEGNSVSQQPDRANWLSASKKGKGIF